MRGVQAAADQVMEPGQVDLRIAAARPQRECDGGDQRLRPDMVEGQFAGALSSLIGRRLGLRRGIGISGGGFDDRPRWFPGTSGRFGSALAESRLQQAQCVQPGIAPFGAVLVGCAGELGGCLRIRPYGQAARDPSPGRLRRGPRAIGR